MCNPVLVTCLTGQASRMPHSRAYTEGFHDLLGGHSPSSEKDLKIFQKSRFLNFLRLSLATCLQVVAPVARYTQKVSQLPLRLPHWWTFQSRKTLRQIFQNFVTRFWRLVCDSVQSRKSCVLRFKDSF